MLAEHGLDPAQIVTIPRGVDLERFDPAKVAPARVEALRVAWGLETHDPRTLVLLAGRLTRIKGHLTLIEAASRLKARGRSDFVMVFAGDDQGRTDYRQELVDTIARQGLTDVIRLTGHCDDMPAAYQLCDFAILPTTVPESFGRTAVEPQAMGKPVIASAHGGTVETVLDGKTGWLIPPGDVLAWADALERAIDLGEAGRQTMGRLGTRRARQLYSAPKACAPNANRPATWASTARR